MKRTYTDTCRRETRVNYTIDYSVSEPVSAWGYVGYNILWGIPVIGWICWLISCFTKKNKNVRNYARSYFCAFILSISITAVITVAFAILVLTGIITFEDIKGYISAIAQKI